VKAETALYAPVKAFLEGLGFSVKGEIDSCDIIAIRPGEPPLLVIGELKLGFSFELILQAVDRLTAADEVWLAVPMTRRGRDQDRRVHRLCRLLGLGLLTVHPKTLAVEVRTRPSAYAPRRDKTWRSRLMREFDRRRGDPTEGGSTRRKIMTAYRQTCLDLAARLLAGPTRPRDLRDITPDPAPMLRRNVYAWFLRPAPGLYDLTPLGRQEALAWLAQHADAGQASPST
jgi:hypothetical protein